MKVQFNLSIGYPTASRKVIVEVEDDADQTDIDEQLQEWAVQHIDTWWDKV